MTRVVSGVMVAVDESLSLAELLCARLCHDLAGPIGAVGTGAELLEDEGGGDLGEEALSLLIASAAMAAGRLRFLRLALGGGTTSVSAKSLRDLTQGYLVGLGTGDGGVDLRWQDGEATAWESGSARLLLNMVMLARDSLPKGGRILVSARSLGEPLIEVRAEGGGAAPGESALIVRGDCHVEPTVRAAQGVFTTRLAASLNMSLHVEVQPDLVTFIAAHR